MPNLATQWYGIYPLTVFMVLHISDFSKIYHVFRISDQVKFSDTSTAESGSEAEDIASPKATRSYSHLRLTPVREEVLF